MFMCPFPCGHDTRQRDVLRNVAKHVDSAAPPQPAHDAFLSHGMNNKIDAQAKPQHHRNHAGFDPKRATGQPVIALNERLKQAIGRRSDYPRPQRRKSRPEENSRPCATPSQTTNCALPYTPRQSRHRPPTQSRWRSTRWHSGYSNAKIQKTARSWSMQSTTQTLLPKTETECHERGFLQKRQRERGTRDHPQVLVLRMRHR